MISQPKRKILQISHGYTPPFLEVANQYASLFDPERDELTSLFLKGPSDARVRTQVVADHQIYLDLAGKDLRGSKIKALRKLIGIIRHGGFSLVIAHRYKAIYLALIAALTVDDLRIIGVVHAYDVFAPFSRKMLIGLFGRRLQLLGVSESIRKNIQVDLSLVGFTRVFSQPNCIDVTKMRQRQLSRKEARMSLGIPADVFVVATVGRLHPEKDQKTLIEAFVGVSSGYPDARLYIFGDGPLYNTLVKQIDTLGVSEIVQLSGFVPDVSRCFAAFDIFVLPSAIEPFGMVLLEAMAAGVPVLSSRSGGGVEVVASEEQLFAIGGVVELREKLLRAFQWSGTDRQRYIDAGSQRLESLFSQEAFLRNFRNLT